MFIELFIIIGSKESPETCEVQPIDFKLATKTIGSASDFKTRFRCESYDRTAFPCSYLALEDRELGFFTINQWLK